MHKFLTLNGYNIHGDTKWENLYHIPQTYKLNNNNTNYYNQSFKFKEISKVLFLFFYYWNSDSK